MNQLDGKVFWPDHLRKRPGTEWRGACGVTDCMDIRSKQPSSVELVICVARARMAHCRKRVCRGVFTTLRVALELCSIPIPDYCSNPNSIKRTINASLNLALRPYQPYNFGCLKHDLCQQLECEIPRPQTV